MHVSVGAGGVGGVVGEGVGCGVGEGVGGGVGVGGGDGVGVGVGENVPMSCSAVAVGALVLFPHVTMMLFL